jgi:hypothetical protein
MFSEAIQNLISDYKLNFTDKRSKKTGPMIHVDEIASKFAKFYEKVRSIVDYREEHLLRQNGIFRSLSRGVLLSQNKHEMAEPLIKEMIRSGYFSNDRIPEEKIDDTQRIIDSLLFIREHLRHNNDEGKGGISQWLMGITASAIEENIDPPIKDNIVSKMMLTAMKKNLIINGARIAPQERDIQLFIAIQRALLRADDSQLSYRLLKFMYPMWDNPTPEQLEWFAANLPKIKKAMEGHLKHKLSSNFFKLCNHYNTVFTLLGDMVFDYAGSLNDPEEIFKEGRLLEETVKKAYQRRYDQQRKRLNRLAFFSIISLFITKVVVALAIEIPVDKYMGNGFSLYHTLVNILVPPMLMVLIIMYIKMPSSGNINLIMNEVRAAVYEDGRNEYLMIIPERRSAFTRYAVKTFFFVFSIAVLYFVFWSTQKLGFTVAATFVLVLFTSIVAATGVKVHNRSRDISLEPPESSMFSFLLDLIAMPFVAIGRAAIAGLSYFKGLVLLFNLIDTPFQVIVLFIENFNVFIKSQKDELY